MPQKAPRSPSARLWSLAPHCFPGMNSLHRSHRYRPAHPSEREGKRHKGEVKEEVAGAGHAGSQSVLSSVGCLSERRRDGVSQLRPLTSATGIHPAARRLAPLSRARV